MSSPIYDFTKSDLLMMVGGQLALLFLIILVVYFGVAPIQFAYADQMRNMLSSASVSLKNSKANSSP